MLLGGHQVRVSPTPVVMAAICGKVKDPRIADSGLLRDVPVSDPVEVGSLAVC